MHAEAASAGSSEVVSIWGIWRAHCRSSPQDTSDISFKRLDTGIHPAKEPNYCCLNTHLRCGQQLRPHL
jgi:hypothetical protein